MTTDKFEALGKPKALPIAECPKIKDLLCFFNEKIDIYETGELLARPITPWS